MMTSLHEWLTKECKACCMAQQLSRVFAICALAAVTGCISFSTVRSAAVTRGLSTTIQAAVASPPGEQAMWFWSDECFRCNSPIGGSDLALSYGFPNASGHPLALGLGLNGFYPYAEGYLQLGSSPNRPFGMGARLGLPLSTWKNHQVYARLDIPLDSAVVLLWNPGLVYHAGNSPNGENPGAFVGFVQGVGVQLGTGSGVFTPSAALVIGRAHHRSGPELHGPEIRAFATAALSVTLGRKPLTKDP